MIINPYSFGFNPLSYDYFVYIAGQSNALGLATGPGTYGLTGVITNAQIYNADPFPGAYEPLEFGVNNQALSSTQFGVELSLGKYLGAELGYDIYLAKFAVNGAGLAEITGAGDDFAPATGTLFPQLVTAVTNAYNELPVLAKPVRKIFVWIQGERDGQGESGTPLVYSSVYDSSWATFITQLESNLGFTWDQIIIGQLSESQRMGYLSTVTGFDQVITKQQGIVAATPSRFKLVDTDNFYTNPTDAAHFNGSGMNNYGVDAAKTILAETITPPPADVAWSPADYDVCDLWLDAKQGITLVGGKVSQWDDLSGNNYHATQSNATFRPTYDDTLDEIVFNADSDLDLSAWVDNFKSETQGEWLFVVKRTDITQTLRLFGLSSTAVTNSHYGVFISSNSASPANRVWTYKQNGAGAGSQLYTNTVIPSETMIISVSHNTFGFKARMNGVHESLLVSSFGNINDAFMNNMSTVPNKLLIGALQTSSGVIFRTKMRLLGMAYFTRQLYLEERTALNTYLTGYYGI